MSPVANAVDRVIEIEANRSAPASSLGPVAAMLEQYQLAESPLSGRLLGFLLDMECLQCRATVYLPKSSIHFRCDSCGHLHRLGDYLGITQDLPPEWAREEAASNLRNALETLTVFHFIAKHWAEDVTRLRHVLFLKDGPLFLRAQLSRLVEPIRAFIQHLKDRNIPLYLVGVEKTGELADHIEEISQHLPTPGDYFLPSVGYLVEEVAGTTFSPATYRNRVSYGSKVVVRLGPNHVIPLDVPTGNFTTEPKEADLFGIEEIATILSEMTSYSHDNALIPIKLVNSYSSISQKPSGDILKAFAGDFFRTK